MFLRTQNGLKLNTALIADYYIRRYAGLGYAIVVKMSYPNPGVEGDHEVVVWIGSEEECEKVEAYLDRMLLDEEMDFKNPAIASKDDDGVLQLPKEK